MNTDEIIKTIRTMPSTTTWRVPVDCKLVRADDVIKLLSLYLGPQRISEEAARTDVEDAARWRYMRDHMAPAFLADLFKLNAQDYAPDESVKLFSQTDKWVDRIVDAARAAEAKR